MKIVRHERYNELVADEGMTLIRKSDGVDVGERTALGRTCWKNGKRLANPEWERMSDYEEREKEGKEE